MDEAELLFTEILDCDRLSLYLNKESKLDRDSSFFISSALKRRIAGEPIQYILGKTEFMGLEFKVTQDTFIPRPETEILVETVMKLVPCVMRHASCVNVLDLGTGSGCIAVSLAKFLPKARIDATDISSGALEVAQYNARKNEVKINFIQSDLFNAHNPQPTTYNLIVSNPPYIPSGEIDGLQSEVRYEPRIALDGDRDGLDFYRRIIKESPYYLKEGGFLIMEMGFGQVSAIESIFQSSGNFQPKEVIKDYNNIDRVIVAKRTGRWIS